jgi:hypothetical protein
LSLTTTEILSLGTANQAYRNVQCSVTFAKSLSDQLGGEVGSVQFSPGFPTSLNPMARRDTYEKEIGKERVFPFTATIMQTRTGWQQQGATITGKITYKRIEPDLFAKANEFANGVAYDFSGAPQVYPDMAYEFVVELDGGVQPNAIGISKRMAFFLNTKTRTLEAVIDDAQKVDSETQSMLPPTVLLRVNTQK